MQQEQLKLGLGSRVASLSFLEPRGALDLFRFMSIYSCTRAAPGLRLHIRFSSRALCVVCARARTCSRAAAESRRTRWRCASPALRSHAHTEINSTRKPTRCTSETCEVTQNARLFGKRQNGTLRGPDLKPGRPGFGGSLPAAAC
jgi:hypothetical protein